MGGGSNKDENKNKTNLTESNMEKTNTNVDESLQTIKDTVDKSFARIEFEVNGTILDANDNYVQMLGYNSPKDLIGNHHSMFVDIAYKNSADYKKFWTDLANGITQDGQFKRISKDGKDVWIQAAYTPVKDKDGKVTKVIKIATNITAQIHAREQAKQAAEELKESKTKYRLQSEEKEKRAAELVIADKELVFQNQEKKNRAAELVIANKELVFQNQEKENRAAELVIANKELAFQNQEKEKRAAKLVIANKELLKAEMEIRKLNKTLEKKVESRTAELVNTNKDLQQFAYVATHDLQEPLRMISSYTQLLERKYKDKLDQDAKDYIHFAVDGAIRMQRLLNDLLEFSRIQTSEKGFDLVNTLTVLGKAISNIQLLIIENNALVTNDDLPILKADESQILRVFQNLIENAIKFKKKTELPKIHISCKKLNNMYQFSVSDNGLGIEMQYHDRIFIIFQRLHSVKDYPGTGMGLAICKRIIEKHGGLIWFESIVDKGTTFYFTIPE